MKFMQKFSGRRLVAIVFLFTTVAYSFLSASGQSTSSPTVINVTGQVQHANAVRFGINMEDQDYWDSGQIMKNLSFQNPGFEAEQFRSIFDCAVVSANTCSDTNFWSPQPANFWQGATYRVVSGSAMGATGTILSSTAASSSASVGQTLTFDKSINMAKGDYVAVTVLMPGNGQHGWWTYPSGGATITSETTDLSPNTPGKQALSLNASGTGQSVRLTGSWDVLASRSFVQMNGNYQVTFRAKSVSGSTQFGVQVERLMTGEAAFLNKTITLTPTWQDYTIPFTASETGSSVGSVQLNFTLAGGTALIDDVSVTQTNSDPTNTTAFRDDVVNTLKALNPGVLRMYGGASIGTNLYDEISPYYARYPEGVVTNLTEQDQVSFGIPEFLALCQFVGADPWITIPTATTPQEITDFMDYLQGDGSTTYSAMRVAQGQTEPWTSVFNKIHIELGNETWNDSFQGEIMTYPAYPLWANQVFGAARQSPGFDAAKFDLVLSGFASYAGYTQSVLQYATQQDSIDAAPYLLFSANNDTVPNIFNALIAEPEMFDSPGGEMYENLQAAQSAITSASGTAKPTGLNVYEVNMSTFNGSVTQSEITQVESSLGAGLTLTEHMLQMMRIGVNYQNVFGLTGWQAGASNGNTVDLYGTAVAMGTTNIQRPSFLGEQLANSAIQGDMLQTQQTGANPTYNETGTNNSDGVQYSGVHYIQSFAFLQGQNHSLILFNLSQTTALPVTFTGANAPTGTVQVGLLNSTNITDNNEANEVVKIATSSLSSFNPATPYMLPAHSMTVLSWTATGTETGASQAAEPVLSVASGTYPTAQTVSISEASPGVNVYYTTDGSTPTASSNVYSSPITVSSAETLSAAAIGPNYVTSPIATASYAISATLPSPIMTPAGGTYASAQTVTLTASPGATIYYTTNGSTPTTASTKYVSPFTISTSETVEAIAVYTGYANTAPVSASYTFVSGTTALNYANGFTSGTMTMNGGAKIVGTALQLTDGGGSEARSVWSSTPVPVSKFITDFSFQLTNTNANGFTFTIQNSGLTALGGNGGSMGYQGVNKSVALKFDFYTQVAGQSNNTGVYTNGATPSLPATDLTPSGVNLHSGDVMQAHVVYDGTYLTLNLTDTVTKAVAVEKFAVNIPATVGANTAYIGFTAATGGLTANQNVLNLMHVDTSGGVTTTPTAAAPAFSVAAGTYASAQTVSITDSTPNAKIYYTTNGSTPTTSSSVYSSALTVSSTETINAIAVASGYTTSSTSSAAYTIESAAAAPTFSMAAGSYTGTQSVTMADSTPNAIIYYTTNGSTPTTSSTKYTGAVSVSATTTLKAIAVASGYNNSSVTSILYTILSAVTGTGTTGTGTTGTGTTGTGTTGTGTTGTGTTGTGTTTAAINFGSGFTSSTGLVLNGGATVTNGLLQLSDGGSNEARSVWYSTPVSISEFTTDFSFQALNATSDGFTFAIQSVGTSAVGYDGGSLGYQGINDSVAVKFDLYNNSGEGSDSTGVYQYGVAPTVPATDLSSTGIDLHSGHVLHAHISYDGTNLTLTLTDTTTNASVTETYAVNIPQVVGNTKAYVGFTAGTGGMSATQNVLSWTFNTTSAAPVAVPTFLPGASTYTSTQTVTISDAAAGATIHYTTDGSTPTASSPTYTTPIQVSASETLQAVAVVSGSLSNTASADYTIMAPAAFLNYSKGFTGNAMALNGAASIQGTTLVLTNGGGSQTSSAWTSYVLPISSFTTDFILLDTNAAADGLTFAIQDNGAAAIGEVGGSLGYAGIPRSFAVKFDLYNNSGEGSDSTGVYSNGAQPTLPSTDLSSSGVSFHSGDPIHVHMTYDGKTLTETLTDTTTNATVTEQYPINIPGVVGSITGHVGFTAATGGASATQVIQNWTYAAGNGAN